MADFGGMVAAMREVQEQILALPGVTGIEVGYRRAGDRPTNELAICVYVTKKSDHVPTDQRIPEAIGGFKTDVIEATIKPDQGLPDVTRYEPVLGGISIGSVVAAGSRGGTLGCLVRDNQSAGLRGLSNSHVLTASGATTGAPVVQPLDPKNPLTTETIGVVDRVPPQQVWTAGGRSGFVDCGTLTLVTRRVTAEIVGIGPVLGRRVIEAQPQFLLNRVRKRGATTGLTHGFIRGVAGSFFMNPGDPNSLLIVNNLTIEFDPSRPENQSQKWAEDGDSGAAVVDAANNVVGLHWGSDTTGKFGWASPIDLVEDILNVTVEVRPPPRVTGLVPASGPSHGGTPVLVQGSGFRLVTPGPLIVEFGGQAATFAGAITDTEIAVLAPPHAAGTADVRVTNAAGTSESVPASTFTYVAAPVVDQVSPSAGSPFGGETTRISGSGFAGVSAVAFGIAPATIVSSGPSEITVLSPPGVPGLEVDVVVVTPQGVSAPSAGSKYRYQ